MYQGLSAILDRTVNVRWIFWYSGTFLNKQANKKHPQKPFAGVGERPLRLYCWLIVSKEAPMAEQKFAFQSRIPTKANDFGSKSMELQQTGGGLIRTG